MDGGNERWASSLGRGRRVRNEGITFTKREEKKEL